MNRYLFSFFLAAVAAPIFAQSANMLPCGVDAVEGEQIKMDMLRNRAAVSPAQIAALRNRRNVTYVPITVHLIGNGQGLDFPNPQGALFCLCALNRDFADQNIQFYFNPNNPIRYYANQAVYTDGYANTSINLMGGVKAANTLNIFIGNAVSEPVAGYYSRGRDLIFIRRSEANMVSVTLTHEAGHFFTLAHTFNGWENLNYDDLYGGAPAPVRNTNNRLVEYVARTGTNTNCDTVADGFCDTEADYYSYRIDCSYNSLVNDPDSARLAPDNSNYMSYFSDACMTTFTSEQRDAIMASLTQRNWLNFPAPNLNTVTSTNVAPTMPMEADTVFRLAANPSQLLNMQWSAAPDAIGYIVHLERMFMGQPIGTIFTQVVYGTAYSQPMSGLNNGAYRWTINPFGRYSACGAVPIIANFVIANENQTAVGVEETAVVAAPSLFCSPNPVERGGLLQVNLHSPKAGMARLSVVDALGREAFAQRVSLQAGEDNLYSLHLPENLSSGVYLLRAETAQGQQVQRIIIR